MEWTVTNEKVLFQENKSQKRINTMKEQQGMKNDEKKPDMLEPKVLLRKLQKQIQSFKLNLISWLILCNDMLSNQVSTLPFFWIFYEARCKWLANFIWTEAWIWEKWQMHKYRALYFYKEADLTLYLYTDSYW